MNDEKNKLKEAFKLSDLLYSKIKDEDVLDWEEKLNEIRIKYRHSINITSLNLAFLERVINWLTKTIPKRVTLDLENVEKVMSPIEKSIYKKILKRASKTIEEEMENIRPILIKLSGSFTALKMNNFKIVNEKVNKEKCRLLENAKRDIKIHQKRYELRSDGTKLSREQEREYNKYKYKCYCKINIIGKDEVLKKENYIEIDGNGIELGKNNFILFVKLALGLTRNNEGWINIESFVQEIDLSFTGIYQLIGRLRENLMKINALDNNIVKELIENKKGGLYRISTHPDFITYNKGKLLNHQDPQIRKLAEELPNNNKDSM